VEDPIEYEKHLLFINKCDAIKAIRELETDTFVISYLSYSKSTFWLYKTISKTNVPYMEVLLGSLPGRRLEDTDNNSLNNFFKIVSRVTIEKIKNIPYRIYFAPYLGIQAADFVVAAGSESLNNYRKSYLFCEKTEILYAPSEDYNKFLEMKLPKYRNEANPANAVFIDPGLLSNRGDRFAMKKDKGMDRERHLLKLRKFFNEVEKETGCIVKIAAHPGYDGCSYPDAFGKRLTIVNKTMEMISRSNFVITHGSTAVSFAVLFGKPIIFLTQTTEEKLATNQDLPINRGIFTDQVIGLEQMASWYGKIPIDIDNLIDVDWDKELKINEDLYHNYKNSFLIAKGTEEINSWQIVANRLKLL
jgi:hypothetical protein